MMTLLAQIAAPYLMLLTVCLPMSGRWSSPFTFPDSVRHLPWFITVISKNVLVHRRLYSTSNQLVINMETYGKGSFWQTTPDNRECWASETLDLMFSTPGSTLNSELSSTRLPLVVHHVCLSAYFSCKCKANLLIDKCKLLHSSK